MEAVFGSSDISSGRALTLTEFLRCLHASQLQQLRARPTFALRQAAAGAQAGADGVAAAPGAKLQASRA